MNLGGWLMLVFAIVVLFGGLGVCIAVAIRVDRKKAAEGKRFESGDD